MGSLGKEPNDANNVEKHVDTTNAVEERPDQTHDHSDGHSDDHSDGDSDSSSEDLSSEDEKKNAPVIVDEEEAAKQVKRERIVQKAILHLFAVKFEKGFKLEDLPSLLAKIQVNNFRPETLGYDSLHDFARKQPKEIIRYDKYKGMLLPALSEEERKKKRNK